MNVSILKQSVQLVNVWIYQLDESVDDLKDERSRAFIRPCKLILKLQIYRGLFIIRRFICIFNILLVSFWKIL